VIPDQTKVPPTVAQQAKLSEAFCTVLSVDLWGGCFNRSVDMCQILASWEFVGQCAAVSELYHAGDNQKGFCYQLVAANTTQTQSVLLLLLQLTCYFPPSHSP